jgi:hypothetical protein
MERFDGELAVVREASEVDTDTVDLAGIIVLPSLAGNDLARAF